MKTLQGDDYPDAAGKHLQDAKSLLGSARYDGASYLSGYVVECSLKCLIQYETGHAKHTHDIVKLTTTLSSLALSGTSKTARYVGPVTTSLQSLPIAQWQPEQRYKAPVFSPQESKAWVDAADAIFLETIGTMWKDGVL